MNAVNHPTDLADGLSDYEIAQLWGVTRSRVFQIRRRAMAKMRAAILEDPELIAFVRDELDFDPVLATSNDTE
jgi:hypothetical protein